jgi:hypothetical protein
VGIPLPIILLIEKKFPILFQIVLGSLPPLNGKSPPPLTKKTLLKIPYLQRILHVENLFHQKKSPTTEKGLETSQ